ncbi:hypothetical protein EYZ11_000960 [Aspergillus tanneri]|uniref:Uncharacterized protein n=1 Tax=Aspergillus tanneri TaxID=1220188 RepID=A0A4S3JVX3_9EURO|nr:hypothetical protein EYZ11_000960 [Aspergillus tanneri]
MNVNANATVNKIAKNLDIYQEREHAKFSLGIRDAAAFGKTGDPTPWKYVYDG